MAQNADGEVLIATSIDTSNIQKGIVDVEKQISNLSTGFEKLSAEADKALKSAYIESLTEEIAATEEQVNELHDKLVSISSTQYESDEYKQVCEDIDRVNESLNKYEEKRKRMAGTGVSTDSQSWKNVNYDIRTAHQQLAKFLEEKQQLEATGKQVISGVDTEQYQQVAKDLSEAEGKLQGMQSRLEQINQEAATLRGRLQYIGSALKATFTLKNTVGAIKMVASGIVNTLSKAGRLTGTIAQKAGQAAKSFAQWSVSHIVSGLKAAASGLKKMVMGSNSMNGKFSSLASEAKSFAIGLLGARSVFTILQNAVNAYMQQNQQLSATLSNVWANLGSLLGPIIERLINLISTVVSYVMQFFSLLGITGKKVSSAIGSAGSAAAAETKKLKKQLASFDELNVMQDNSSGSGGGGGSGSGTNAGNLASVELPDWAKLMAEQLKNGDWAAAAKTMTDQLNAMVASVDWAGIGDKIGYYLNGALTFLATFIQSFDWYNLGASLGELINHVIYGVDWANLGVVLGAKFIILIEGLGGLFATIDWAALGKALADAFMGLWNAIDWVQAATTLSTGIIGALSSLSTAIKSVDWQKLGHDVATFIATIDWTGITDALFDGIGAALGGITAFLWGFIKDAWNSVVDWWYENAYEDGEFTMSGLLKGIWNGIKNIGTWIYEHIFKPFIDGFKEAFGIASPSTIMAEQGNFIIEGLLQGITNAWNGITEFISNSLASIKNTISQAWSNVKSTASQKWSEIKSTVSNTWNNLNTGAAEKFGALKTNVLNAWDAIKNSKTWQTISSTLSSTWTNLKAKASTTFTGMKTAIVSIFTSLKNAIKTPINAIIGVINGLISGIVSGINSAISVLNRLKISIPSWVPGVGGKSLGFNISRISAPRIPYLAKGAVIPPNAPFMAMLGDQRHGTNIEAPLETIQEAVAIVMDGMAGGMMAGFESVVRILSDILEAILGIEIGDDVIANAVRNYNRKMSVVNGG